MFHSQSNSKFFSEPQTSLATGFLPENGARYGLHHVELDLHLVRKLLVTLMIYM